MFAYDLYLFGEANMKQLRVTNCLQLLCRLLDQKVNETKSYIFFPPKNTKAEIRPQIFFVYLLEFNTTDNLRLYLGVPSSQNSRSRIKNYKYVLDEVKRRLAGWKMNWVTLVNFVTNDIPKYISNDGY